MEINSEFNKLTGTLKLLLDDNKNLRSLITKRDKETYVVLNQATSFRDNKIHLMEEQNSVLKEELQKSLEVISQLHNKNQEKQQDSNKESSKEESLQTKFNNLSVEFAGLEGKHKDAVQKLTQLESRNDENRKLMIQKDVEICILKEKLEIEARQSSKSVEMINELEKKIAGLMSEKSKFYDNEYKLTRSWENHLEEKNKELINLKIENQKLKRIVDSAHKGVTSQTDPTPQVYKTTTTRVVSREDIDELTRPVGRIQLSTNRVASYQSLNNLS